MLKFEESDSNNLFWLVGIYKQENSNHISICMHMMLKLLEFAFLIQVSDFACLSSKLYIICNWTLLHFLIFRRSTLSEKWKVEQVEMSYMGLLGQWSNILFMCYYSTGDEKESVKICACEGVCSRSWVSWSLPILHLTKCHLQVRGFLRRFQKIILNTGIISMLIC